MSTEKTHCVAMRTFFFLSLCLSLGDFFFVCMYVRFAIRLFTFFSEFLLCIMPSVLCIFSMILLALHKILRVFYVYILQNKFCLSSSSRFSFFSHCVALFVSLFFFYYYFKWNFVMCSTDEIINANVIIANRRDV